MMLEIEAGTELDRAVGEAIGIQLLERHGQRTYVLLRDWIKLTGQDVPPTCEEGGSLSHIVVSFHPSTDLEAAFAAAEQVGLFDYDEDAGETHLAKNARGEWKLLTKKAEFCYVTIEPTPALAICAAILRGKESSQ